MTFLWVSFTCSLKVDLVSWAVYSGLQPLKVYCVNVFEHAYISILKRTVRTSLVGFITLEMLVNIRSGSIINHFVQNSNISSSWRVQILEERISISLIQSRFKLKIKKWHLYKKNKTCWNGINLCKRNTTLSLFHLTFRGFT